MKRGLKSISLVLLTCLLTFNVSTQGTATEFEGKYLYLGANADNNPQTLEFGFISDTEWTGSGLPQIEGQPKMMITETDRTNGIIGNKHDDWIYTTDKTKIWLC